ncbi:MAG: hypothetical protein O2943_06745 [Actinomycetota bacterium]|nr:hypothetical protein [Actinomycetota bacterium]
MSIAAPVLSHEIKIITGYSGWYVIEQDTGITCALLDAGAGPIQSVSQSLDLLRDVVAPLVDRK